MFARYIIEMSTKVLWLYREFNESSKQSIAGPATIDSEVKIILFDMCSKIKALAKWALSEVAKSSSKERSESFYVLLQAAAIANNCDLEFDEGTQPSEISQRIVVESPHPFKECPETNVRVHNPHATGYMVSFDERTELTSNEHLIYLYKDDSRKDCWGEAKGYTSSKNLPGLNGVPPLHIPADFFVVSYVCKHRAFPVGTYVLIKNMSTLQATKLQEDVKKKWTKSLAKCLGQEAVVTESVTDDIVNVRVLETGTIYFLNVAFLTRSTSRKHGGTSAFLPKWGFLLNADIVDVNNMKETKVVETVSKQQIIESRHNYDDNLSIKTKVRIPGASAYKITFDERSKTEYQCDYIRFLREGKSEYWGEEK